MATTADSTLAKYSVYRAEMASRDGHRGRPLSAETLQDSHATIRIFLREADNEDYKVDPRLLKLPRVKVPAKEPTVYHIAQLRQILGACNPAFPQQDLAVRILVGSGVRISELCGIAVDAPDGLPDLMLDSIDRGRLELRVRWDGGAKGKKSRRVPITPKLASAIKRYQAKHRPEVDAPELLISPRLTAYDAAGIDTVTFVSYSWRATMSRRPAAYGRARSSGDERKAGMIAFPRGVGRAGREGETGPAFTDNPGQATACRP